MFCKLLYKMQNKTDETSFGRNVSNRVQKNQKSKREEMVHENLKRNNYLEMCENPFNNKNDNYFSNKMDQTSTPVVKIPSVPNIFENNVRSDAPSSHTPGKKLIQVDIEQKRQIGAKDLNSFEQPIKIQSIQNAQKYLISNTKIVEAPLQRGFINRPTTEQNFTNLFSDESREINNANHPPKSNFKHLKDCKEKFLTLGGLIVLSLALIFVVYFGIFKDPFGIEKWMGISTASNNHQLNPSLNNISSALLKYFCYRTMTTIV